MDPKIKDICFSFEDQFFDGEPRYGDSWPLRLSWWLRLKGWFWRLRRKVRLPEKEPTPIGPVLIPFGIGYWMKNEVPRAGEVHFVAKAEPAPDPPPFDVEWL